MEITIAKRTHSCRQNERHRIEKGAPRLSVREDGNDHHYCLPCAESFLAKDIKRMQALLNEVQTHLARTTE